MKRVLYNNCYGGYNLSGKAVAMYLQKILHKDIIIYDVLHGKSADIDSATSNPCDYIFLTDKSKIPDRKLSYDERNDIDECTKSGLMSMLNRISFRSDALLLSIFDEIGSEAFSGPYSNIQIENVPDNTMYTITEYDGNETVKYRYNDEEWCVADPHSELTHCSDCIHAVKSADIYLCEVWHSDVTDSDFCSRAYRKDVTKN